MPVHDRFELVGDLCLSLLKIVTAARAVAEDPAVDGFGQIGRASCRERV